ncbi:MAG: ribonuclease J [Firmicutes bacterium]|nr:ribonuclease J [Bacillota bacterium]
MSKIKIFALGGQNEIGKNMYIVEVDERIYVFEAGLKYADDKLLGVDYIIPNYDYLKENKDRIKGIFITHGHDQQMGALSDILIDIPDIKIYGGKFTLEIIKQDLEESSIKSANLIEIKAHKKIDLGEESIFPIQVSHALPDSYLYVLNTKDGAIVFSGNYIFDPSMNGPYSTDIGKLAYIGKQSVLCLMNESMYAEKKGFTSPNHRASSIIRETIDENEGRIFFNIFETQIYRIQELFNEIYKTDRNVVIMGKALENIILKGIDFGYIDFDRERIKTISHVNDEGILVIISNEREKPYSSLKRILRNSDKFVTLKEKDTVVILSPIYESSEITATQVFNKISKVGSKLVILSKKYLSPHSSSEDIMLMINLMKPKYYLPVTGEYRHQVENAILARQLEIPDKNILLKLNGEVTTFIDGELVDNDEKVSIEDVLIDGKTVGDIGDLVLKDREMLSDSGIVIVNANIDKQSRNIINKPNIVTKGFIYVKENIDIIKEAESIVGEVIKENVKENYIDYNKLKISIRDRLGKYFYKETESKPMIIIVVQEV